jgi:hypothetical protein
VHATDPAFGARNLGAGAGAGIVHVGIHLEAVGPVAAGGLNAVFDLGNAVNAGLQGGQAVGQGGVIGDVGCGAAQGGDGEFAPALGIVGSRVSQFTLKGKKAILGE